jgi:hypothetical protein
MGWSVSRCHARPSAIIFLLQIRNIAFFRAIRKNATPIWKRFSAGDDEVLWTMQGCVAGLVRVLPVHGKRMNTIFAMLLLFVRFF